MPDFHVVSSYVPSGDQPEAIDALASGLERGIAEQTLLGVTGSGKTYTMAKVIERIQRPTLDTLPLFLNLIISILIYLSSLGIGVIFSRIPKIRITGAVAINA